MENKLKTFLKSHLWMIIIVGLAVAAIAFFSIQTGCETKQFNQTVGNRRNEANKAVQEAVNANNAAVNISIERQVEDGMREQTITPELGRRRRNSENSKTALEEARKTHHEKKNDTSNLSRSESDNCRELAGLFPDIRFEDCQ